MTKVYPAQILAITLLALFVIAIVVVGAVSVATRDIRQTTTNKEYQTLYNSSETQIFQMIDKYSNPSIALSQLPQDFSGSCPSVIAGAFDSCNCLIQQANKYRCTFIKADVQSSADVEDTATVVDYELGKDEALDLRLNGYRGDIIFSWNGAAAWEFGLHYQLGTENRFTADLFDLNSVFSSNGGDPLLNPFANHKFPFVTVAAGEYKFRIADISGLPAAARPLSLRIVARKPQPGAVKLNVRGETGLPTQIRKFISTSYRQGGQTGVVATAITQLPLTTQALAIFNYTLLTGGGVTKAAPTF